MGLSRPELARDAVGANVTEMRLFVTLALLLGPAAAAAAAPVQLDYEAYVAGLPVFSIQSKLALSARDYSIEIGYRTHGLVDAFFHADLHSVAHGAFEGIAPRPQRFTAWGAFRGTARQTLIDYPDDNPLVRVLEPPNDREREPVPPEARARTVDTLSALAMLVHAVAQTGRCEGSVRVVDGRRLSEIAARTGGEEMLEPAHDSPFAGRALRCDFTGRQLAGFVFHEDRARQAEPQEGAAWLAPALPGHPPLPVRIRFQLRLFGDATAYLTRAAPAE